jgi:AmmeMemoRadiSam system protein B
MAVFIILPYLFCTSCSPDEGELVKNDIAYIHEAHPTALSLNPDLLDSLFPGGLPRNSFGRLDTPVSERPIGGTVSHHLLAAEEIDRWFRTLADSGNIDTFIIISPSHWVSSGGTLKVSDLPWDGGIDLVDCDTDAVEFLLGAAELSREPDAFHKEHGIDVLIPYIAAYFPESLVVPILQREETLNTAGLRELADAIIKLTNANPEKRYFLIISTDFSHHADPDLTALRDSRTKASLPQLSSDKLPGLYSDNRGGLLVLSEYLGNSVRKYQLIGHTNSYRISGRDKDDITSYFFTLYW